jgi:ABC-type dipeptide/oligopeptide/nickel transport system permease subunit
VVAVSGVDASVREITEIPPRVSEFRRFIRVFFGRKVVVFGLAVIVILILVAILAPVIAPFEPNKQSLTHTLEDPSREHLLGTDALGRDMLSRIIYGTRISLMISLIVVGVASAGGTLLGLIAGYFGGWVYAVIMRCLDSLMAFPLIILALLIASLLGGGLLNVVIALSIAMMPVYGRLMCGQVLAIKENDYVLAGRALGGSNLRIMFRHVLPNCFPPLIVAMTMQIGAVVLAEAGLGFLGIGVETPTATWGGMINDGRQYLRSLPVLSLSPGAAIMLLVFSFNIVGDGLRDALDPRLRGTL